MNGLVKAGVDDASDDNSEVTVAWEEARRNKDKLNAERTQHEEAKEALRQAQTEIEELQEALAKAKRCMAFSVGYFGGIGRPLDRPLAFFDG